MSQEARLFPHLTVAENVAFAPSSQRLPRAEVGNRVSRWLAAAEVSELADRKPDELSGGQAQRVAIARAMAAEPRILLLDEPFRALDVDVASRLRALLRGLLADHGRTTIMVTHDPVDALGLAEDIVVLDRGEGRRIRFHARRVDQPGQPVQCFAVGAQSVRGADGRDRRGRGRVRESGHRDRRR